MKNKKHPIYSVPKPSTIPNETLEILNRRELLISGVLGIEEYHTEKVCVKTEKGIVAVCGCTLSLCWAGDKRLLLRGNLTDLHFENRPPKKGGYRSCR